jgi:hypothetical protein
MDNDIAKGIENLKAAMIAAYNKQGFRQDMQDRFADRIAVKPGKKYIKVMTDVDPARQMGSAYCFIVATDDDAKFRRGDILKPASWSAPVRNFARGNVLDGKDFDVSPYGL